MLSFMNENLAIICTTSSSITVCDFQMMTSALAAAGQHSRERLLAAGTKLRVDSDDRRPGADGQARMAQ